MSKKLSVREFKEVCANNSFGCFIYSTGNQEPTSQRDSLTIDFVSSVMLVSCNPNIISLVLDNQTLLTFTRVVYVEQEQDGILGTIFNIVCKEFEYDGGFTCYHIIAR